MFDIITFGSATKDIVVKPKNLTSLKYTKASASQEVCFPFGSKIDIEEIHFNTGGGGTNTAATFAKQGFKTAFCGVVGQDLSGQELINELKSLKIDTRFVVKTEKKATNHSIVVLGNMKEDRTILAYRGAAELLEKSQIPFKKLHTKWLYLAPLSGQLCDSFEDLVNFAFERKIKIAVNPGLAQLSLTRFKEITKRIDVLILNQEEASFLTKIPYEQEHEIFQKIDAMCPGVVVMTKGGSGVTVSDNTYLYSAVPPVDRNIVDTTGAGDAFGSGFVSEFMKTGSIESAIQLGMANSVGCLSQIGAKQGLLKKGEGFEKAEVIKEVVQ